MLSERLAARRQHQHGYEKQKKQKSGFHGIKPP
jgi:hypothetical protein